jgi:preprotein translocase subunit SecA
LDEPSLYLSVLAQLKPGEPFHLDVFSELGDERGESWNLDGLVVAANSIIPLPPQLGKDALSRMSRREIEQKLLEYAETLYEEKEKELGPQNMRSCRETGDAAGL